MVLENIKKVVGVLLGEEVANVDPERALYLTREELEAVLAGNALCVEDNGRGFHISLDMSLDGGQEIKPPVCAKVVRRPLHKPSTKDCYHCGNYNKSPNEAPCHKCMNGDFWTPRDRQAEKAVRGPGFVFGSNVFTEK